MPTRNVVLTDHQSDLIDRLVASGRYQNASEAMREGVRLLEDHEAASARLSSYLDAIESHSELGDVEGPDAIRHAFARARARRDSPAAE